MGIYHSEFEKWNTTSVDMCMGFLINKLNIILYFRTKKIEIISKQLYDFLDKKMENFIYWYENNKLDNYLPSHGLKKMYSLNLIKKVYYMNKYTNNVKTHISILKLWNKKDILNCNENIDDIDNNDDIDDNDNDNDIDLKNIIFIDKKNLLNIPNDPLIYIF